MFILSCPHLDLEMSVRSTDTLRDLGASGLGQELVLSLHASTRVPPSHPAGGRRAAGVRSASHTPAGEAPREFVTSSRALLA